MAPEVRITTLLILIGSLILGAEAGAGAYADRHRKLTELSYQQNPYTYIMGNVLDGEVVDGKATSLRIAPSYTFLLYDENILLCGDVTNQLNGIRQPMILTYEKASSRIVDGVGCHNLVGVNEVKSRLEK